MTPAAWALVGVLALGLLWPGLGEPLDDLIALGMLAAVVAVVERASGGQLPAAARAASPGARRVGAGLVAAFLVGHLVDAERWTYPLTSWQMYTEVPEERALYRFDGYAAGEPVEFLPEARRLRLGGGTLHVRAQDILRWLEELESDPAASTPAFRDELRQATAELVRGMARAHNLTREPRVDEVRVTRLPLEGARLGPGPVVLRVEVP